MLKTKFENLASELESKINSMHYKDKLPAIRDLSECFSVAPATMQRAVRELVKKGIVTPRGPKGNYINRRAHIRPQTDIIGIFSNFKGSVETDPLLSELQKVIQNDDKLALFMNLPRQTIVHDDSFWEKNWVDGYIFVYSTISKALAYQLRLKGIPFAVANRCPEDFGANWVDFDHIGAVREAVKMNLDAGRRSIAVCMQPIHLKSTLDYLYKNNCEVLSEFGFDDSSFVIAQHIGLSNEEMARESARTLMAQPVMPDAVIINGLPVNEFIAELRSNDVEVPDISYIGDGNIFEPSGCKEFSFSYRKLAHELWEMFKRQHLNSAAHVKQILLKPKFVHN